MWPEAAMVRTCPSDREAITSGRSPEAADEVMTWLNRCGGTPTRSAFTPVAAVNCPMTARSLSMRSGSVSVVQTVMLWWMSGVGAGGWRLPGVQATRKAAAREIAARTALTWPLVLFTWCSCHTVPQYGRAQGIKPGARLGDLCDKGSESVADCQQHIG